MLICQFNVKTVRTLGVLGVGRGSFQFLVVDIYIWWLEEILIVQC